MPLELPSVTQVAAIFIALLFSVGLYKLVQVLYFKSKTMQAKLLMFQDVFQDYSLLYDEFYNWKQHLKFITFSETYSIYNDAQRSYVISVSKFVVDNALEDPVKYIAKYFAIGKSDNSIRCLEDYSSDILEVLQHQRVLKDLTVNLAENVRQLFPVVLRLGVGKLITKKLLVSAESLEINPYTLVLNYISKKGHSSSSVKFVLNSSNTTQLLQYAKSQYNAKSSASSERAKLTPELRQQILARDYHTCCNCGLNTQDEPNLLLEVDHIVPISRGGKTVLSNLQTLCWKCNRAKSDDIEFGPDHPFTKRHMQGKFRDRAMCSPTSLMNSDVVRPLGDLDAGVDISQLHEVNSQTLTRREQAIRNRQQRMYTNAQHTGISVSNRDLRGFQSRNNNDFKPDLGYFKNPPRAVDSGSVMSPSRSGSSADEFSF